MYQKFGPQKIFISSICKPAQKLFNLKVKYLNKSTNFRRKIQRETIIQRRIGKNNFYIGKLLQSLFKA